MKIALTAAALFSPLESIENGVLVIEDGRILKVGTREAVEIPAGAKHVDFGDAVLAPGFVDIHIHGGAGHDVMEGEPDEAFKWLEKAISLGNENLPWFESNPVWQPLHSDPRFKELMRRVEVGREQRKVFET